MIIVLDVLLFPRRDVQQAVGCKGMEFRKGIRAGAKDGS